MRNRYPYDACGVLDCATEPRALRHVSAEQIGRAWRDFRPILNEADAAWMLRQCYRVQLRGHFPARAYYSQRWDGEFWSGWTLDNGFSSTAPKGEPETYQQVSVFQRFYPEPVATAFVRHVALVHGVSCPYCGVVEPIRADEPRFVLLEPCGFERAFLCDACYLSLRRFARRHRHPIDDSFDEWFAWNLRREAGRIAKQVAA